MTPERRKQVEKVFQEALDREPGLREAFLEAACGGDGELRHEVASLLTAHETQPSLLGGAVKGGPVSAGPAGGGHDALAPGERLGGRYEIVRFIARGGMGEVYEARDTRLGRTVAVKLLPRDVSARPGARERFEREARAISSLSHPHICALFDVVDDDGRSFLVMELLEGSSLAQRLAPGPLAIEEVLRHGREIAGALAAAHRRGITHRDLKPGNVILTAAGAKLVDFGLAKLRERTATGQLDEGQTKSRPEEPLTQEGVVVGTLAYMSPEQLEGKEVDHRSDLFALGAILYEMVTGQRAFTGRSRPGVAEAILSREPRPVGQLRPAAPPALARLIRKCLAKDPAERVQSAGEVALDLESIAGEKVASDPARPELPPPPESVSSRSRKRRQAWLATPVVIAGALAAAWLVLPRHRTPEVGAPGGSRSGLVVLPCQVFGRQELGFLTDAVPSTLSTFLGQVPGLDTRRPPTSLRVDPAKADLRQVAESYRVQHCVTCTVTAEGQRLLLAIQLVEPESDRLLWTHAYEGTVAGYLDLIRQSAGGIRQALALGAPTATPGSREYGQSRAGIRPSSEAELVFRRGRYHLDRFNHLRKEEDFEAARAAYEMALDLDPRRAETAADLALLYFWRLHDSLPERHERVETWARRALEIDPACARAWVALGYDAHGPEGKVIDVRRRLEYGLRALHHDPQEALACWLIDPSSATLFLEGSRQAALRDPFYTWGHVGEGDALLLLGRSAKAAASLERALAAAPGLRTAAVLLAIAYVKLGRLDEAEELMAGGPSGEPGRQAGEEYAGSLALHVARGDAVRIRADVDAIRSALERPPENNFLYYLAHHGAPDLLRCGEAALAVRLLRACAEAGSPAYYDWLMLNPEIEALRKLPEFTQIARRSREHFSELLEVLDAARARGELPEFFERPLADLTAKLGLAWPRRSGESSR